MRKCRQPVSTSRYQFPALRFEKLTLFLLRDRVGDAHGMPVALQVMCPRLEEETVVGLMEAIEEALNETRR